MYMYTYTYNIYIYNTYMYIYICIYNSVYMQYVYAQRSMCLCFRQQRGGQGRTGACRTGAWSLHAAVEDHPIWIWDNYRG